MSVIPPLTASSDIARSSPKETPPLTKGSPLTPNLGVFAADVVNISSLGLEKQQKEIEIDAAKKIKNIANDVVRVSSTIGRARSVGNLTSSQASELYNKIASLI